MWERIDSLLARAPSVRALRVHKVELLEARRRRTAGLPALPDLATDEASAAFAQLSVPALLTRARAAYDGRLLVVKGPEVALDYPAPELRSYGDVDLLADDAEAAQAALLAAGFCEVGDPSIYEDIHHLRPLGWPGLPLTIELHSRPKWPDGMPGPSTAELLAAAVPSRIGVAGIESLPPAHHAVLLAAHAWAHEPLGRLGHLIDVAATAARADRTEAAALARAWGCRRMWRTTDAAAYAVLHGDRRSAAAALWGRHLTAARERTVLEMHLHRWLPPLWGAPLRHAAAGVGQALAGELRRDGDERWRTKIARSRMAVANAGVARAEHELALEARGHAGQERTKTT
jgi:hypothetical protein